MPTYAYIPQPLADPDGASFEASRGVIQQLACKLGLHVDREFIEAPGACYVAWEKRDWRLSPLADRPVGRELLAALQPGDNLLVDKPMIEPRQFPALITAMAERGVKVCIASLEHRGLSCDSQLASLFSLLFALDRCCTSRSTRDGMLAAKVEGRPRGGRPAPGWKHVGPPERRRRVPDEEERSVMTEIVKLRLKGWGFRKIASLLAREGVMYRVPDRKRRLGYGHEFWSAGRCERGYAEMLRIMAEERAKE